MRPPALLASLLLRLGGCLIVVGTAMTAHAQRAVVVVRHAEKLDESSQAPLSLVGKERAARLAETLAPLGIRAIFATEFQRTQQTAQPLADRLSLKLTVVPAKERAALLQKLAALQASDAALVVSHSDTLPLLLRDLGVAEPVQIQPGDYGNLFIVVSVPGKPPTLLRLRF